MHGELKGGQIDMHEASIGYGSHNICIVAAIYVYIYLPA